MDHSLPTFDIRYPFQDCLKLGSELIPSQCRSQLFRSDLLLFPYLPWSTLSRGCTVQDIEPGMELLLTIDESIK